jgi:hypothetical protein
MLSNDGSSPMSDAISHEWHEQIINREVSSLYSILNFTYLYKNIINTYIIDTVDR